MFDGLLLDVWLFAAEKVYGILSELCDVAESRHIKIVWRIFTLYVAVFIYRQSLVGCSATEFSV